MTDLVMKILFSTMCAGLGMMLLLVGVREYFLQQRTLANAAPIEAVVTSSRVIQSTSTDTDPRLGRDNSTTSYSPEVRFRYTIRGVQYESDMLRPTIIVRGFASQSSAMDEIKPFPAGATVKAYVDPAVPARAFLIAEPSWFPKAYIVIGLTLMPLTAVIFRYL